MTKESRIIIPLLKARVTDRSDSGFTIHFGAEHGSPTTIRLSCKTEALDLHDGDLLTLYTEVMLAKPSRTPIQ